MPTVQLVTVIDAPVDRCFRLALHAGLAQESMRPWALEGGDGVPPGAMSAGDEVRWVGSQKGTTGDVTELVLATRAPGLIRRRLAGGRLAVGEMEQHFAPFNNGTRMWEEMRFAVAGRWLRGFRERRLRRRMLQMMRTRTEALKRVAESEDWRQYLERL